MVLIFVVWHFVRQIVLHNISISSIDLLFADWFSCFLILFSHVHIFKYENIEYNLANLEYTRIALGDPNNNSFSFEHCRFSKSRTSCFNIKTKSNAQTNQGGCYPAGILSEEIDNREYKLNESLLYKKSRNNRILIAKTNNLMPNFVENLLKCLK